MSFFKRKKNYRVYYWVYNPLCKYNTIIKAKDIADAVKKLERKESFTVSVI